MHELSFVKRIVDQVLYILNSTDLNDEYVSAVRVSVGTITGVIPSYLIDYYNKTINNTLLEKSELIVTTEEVQIECAECQLIYMPSKNYNYYCPYCGSKKGRIVSGRDIRIEEIILSSKEG